MTGYCGWCDRWVARLFRKGRVWACENCLERTL